jgi:ABC-type microcin C transport system permease subunit YejB
VLRGRVKARRGSNMKKWLVAAAALVIIVGVPVAYAASPNAQGQSGDDSAAAKACKAERGTTAQSIEAFKNKYGTNKNKANAFGKCVSGKSKSKSKDEKVDDDKDENSAAKACKAERGTTAQSIEAFKNKYGTNKNKANAFGKCVSGKSKSKDKTKDND